VDPGHYALWLMPSGKVYVQLTKIITELASEFSAPCFDPHVTLLGGITGEKVKIVRQCEQLADSLSPFDIHFTDLGRGDDYYRRLFIQIAQSPALLQANGRAREVFDHSGHPDYRPHVSLLYSNRPAELKGRITANGLGAKNRKCSVDRFFLIDLAGEPQNWTRIGDFLFQKGRRQ
jgi:2'-5' RNA ligase